MCGIVGYVGDKNAQKFLINGLKRLEYRGYDSAGIVTLSTEPTLLRALGKITELEKLAQKSPKKDSIGIGHTRWATHGEPSVKNAHPHLAGDIYLVHNGIIENYHELKEQLKDYEFKSDTDSEVLAALIDSFYKKNNNLLDAVTQALKLVVGTYGIAVLSVKEPDKIVVARSGSPLIIGVGDNETFIASDASAILGHTKNAIYLNDGDVALCTKNNIEIFDLNSQAVSHETEVIETDLAAIQKQGYDHFLIKEIMEQPNAITDTASGRIIDGQIKLGGLNLSPSELRDIDHILIVGCGTAYHAGLLASYYIGQIVNDVTVEVVIASEYRYRSSTLPKNSVALIVSQSGETADTLACMRLIKQNGIKTLGIINVVGSTIAREVDGGIYVHAGPEISVASTKAFSCQVVGMLMFALSLAQARGMNQKHIKQFIHELELLPNEIKNLLETCNDEIKQIAKDYTKYEHAIYLGRDTAYPVAMEGALKLKEISYIDANGYPAGELKHGPLALVDDRFFEVFLMPAGDLFAKSMSNLQEVNARGGHVVVFTDSKEKINAEKVLRITTELNSLTPMLLNVMQQLLAYYIAVERGNDVDQPRNLAKSVTVE